MKAHAASLHLKVSLKKLVPYLSTHDISSSAGLLSGLKAAFSSDFFFFCWALYDFYFSENN
jgi:hypothetical protein